MSKPMINRVSKIQKISGPSVVPPRYQYDLYDPPIPTALFGGAEINPEPISLQAQLGEVQNDWNGMNIRSGVNQTDCPSRFGLVNRGLRSIGGLVFTPENDIKGWVRNKGKPVL